MTGLKRKEKIALLGSNRILKHYIRVTIGFDF